MSDQRRTRVLFVDDNPVALMAAKASLTAAAPQWEFRFAASGSEALTLLEFQGSCDVVVSDLHMPFMDGPTLLATVKSKYPETVRIIVSDARDLSTSLRCIPVAHQFLGNSFNASELCEAIARSLELQSRIENTDLLEVLGGAHVLPSPPLSVVELNRALSKPEASVDDIALVIARDPAMTAKLLQLVNSAFFGLSHRIGDVHQAVSYLGLTTVRNLLTAVELVRAFTSPSVELMQAVEEIHAHSLAVAELARSLVQGHQNGYDAFTAGMLHDVGMLALVAHAPEKFVMLKDELAHNPAPADDIEREIIGASHTQLGAYLLNLWGLPHDLVEAVARSHDADQLTDRNMSPVHAIFIAEQLTNMLGSPTSWESGDVPQADYLVELDMDGEVQQLMSHPSSLS